MERLIACRISCLLTVSLIMRSITFSGVRNLNQIISEYTEGYGMWIK